MTATVVHNHRNQNLVPMTMKNLILHFESLLEIHMVAGT